jgi:hypothetical protein
MIMRGPPVVRQASFATFRNGSAFLEAKLLSALDLDDLGIVDSYLDRAIIDRGYRVNDLPNRLRQMIVANVRREFGLDCPVFHTLSIVLIG